MQYMLLIYSNEADEPTPGTPEFDEHIAGYMALSKEVRDKGIVVSAEPLEKIATATTVRDRPQTSRRTTRNVLDCDMLLDPIGEGAQPDHRGRREP